MSSFLCPSRSPLPHTSWSREDRTLILLVTEKNKQKNPQTNLGQSVGESPVRGNPLTHWELASLACEHQGTGKHQNILLSKEKPGKGQGSSYHSIGPRLAWLSMLSRSTFLSLFVPGGALAETGGPNPNFRCEKSVKICGLSTCTLPTD